MLDLYGVQHELQQHPAWIQLPEEIKQQVKRNPFLSSQVNECLKVEDVSVDDIILLASDDSQNTNISASGSPTPSQTPDQDPDKKRKTDKATAEVTDKQAGEIAKQLGFRKTNYRSQGRVIFTDEKRFITIDNTAHNGGFWKMATKVKDLLRKTTRSGTYDKYLRNRIGD